MGCVSYICQDDRLAPGIRTWKKEHLALFDRDVAKCIVLYDPEKHVAFDLVEPFLLISLAQHIPLETYFGFIN